MIDEPLQTFLGIDMNGDAWCFLNCHHRPLLVPVVGWTTSGTKVSEQVGAYRIGNCPDFAGRLYFFRVDENGPKWVRCDTGTESERQNTTAQNEDPQAPALAKLIERLGGAEQHVLALKNEVTVLRAKITRLEDRGIGHSVSNAAARTHVVDPMIHQTPVPSRCAPPGSTGSLIPESIVCVSRETSQAEEYLSENGGAI